MSEPLPAMDAEPGEAGEAATLPPDEPASAACLAPPESEAEASRATGWPWARIARPAVIEAGSGGAGKILDAGPVAAIDFAIAATRDALATVTGLPVTLAAAPEAAAQSPTGYGAAFSAGEREVLVMLDPQAVRLLATAVAMSAGAAPSPAAPGPIAEAGDVDKGLIEYLTLVALDRVLRACSPQTAGPTLRAFCDAGSAGVWLQKHSARPFTLAVMLAGSAGVARLYVSGLDDDHAAALNGCLSLLDWKGAPPSMVNVAVALPAVAVQPPELAGMQPGDVLLLGGPLLTQLPGACELVTDTNWSLGPVAIAHDTPSYLSVAFSPAHPAPRRAALAAGQTLIQPVIGTATVPIARLALGFTGEALPLTKDPVAPVTLLAGVRPIARGELIILGSELGVRLLEVNANP